MQQNNIKNDYSVNHNLELKKLHNKFIKFYPQISKSFLIQYKINKFQDDIIITNKITSILEIILEIKFPFFRLCERKDDNIKKPLLDSSIDLFKKCRDFDIAAYYSYKIKKNFICYDITFLRNNYCFYVRKSKDEKKWSVEIHIVSKESSKMLKEDFNEFENIKKKSLLEIICNDNNIQKKYDEDKYNNMINNSKKLHFTTLEKKLKILKKYISQNMIEKIKEYHWLSKEEIINNNYKNNKNFRVIKSYNMDFIADLHCSELEWDFPPTFWPQSETFPID